jgi:hypothetical protein
MVEKVIIFDSGTLISFAMNGLLPELVKLKEIFNGKFIIPIEVKKEIIDTPIEIKKFELQAMKLKDLFSRNILETPNSLDIKQKDISKITLELLNKANTLLVSKNKDVELISSGETACLALSKILSDRKIDNLIAADERTIRVLCENPRNLKNLMERKLHSKVEFKKENFEEFKGFRFIRSTELIYIVYKKGLIELKEEKLLDALLWALKSTGCAISTEEIEEIKSIAKREGF